MAFVVRTGTATTDPITGVVTGRMWRSSPLLTRPVLPPGPSSSSSSCGSDKDEREGKDAPFDASTTTEGGAAGCRSTRARICDGVDGKRIVVRGGAGNTADADAAADKPEEGGDGDDKEKEKEKEDETTTVTPPNLGYGLASMDTHCFTTTSTDLASYMSVTGCTAGFRAHKVHDDMSSLTNLYVFSSVEYGVGCLIRPSGLADHSATFTRTPLATSAPALDPDIYPVQYVRSNLDAAAIFAVDFITTPTTTSATVRLTPLDASVPLRLIGTGFDRSELTTVPEPVAPADETFAEFTFQTNYPDVESVIPVYSYPTPPLDAPTDYPSRTIYYIRSNHPILYAVVTATNVLRFLSTSTTNALTDANQFMFTLASAPTAATRLYNIQCMRTGFKKYISFVKSGTVTTMVMVNAPDANSQFSLEMDTAVLGNFRIYHPITDRFLIVSNLTSNFQPGGVAGAVTSSFSLYSKRLVDGDP